MCVGSSGEMFGDGGCDRAKYGRLGASHGRVLLGNDVGGNRRKNCMGVGWPRSGSIV